MFKNDFCASITASAPRWNVSMIAVAGLAVEPSCFLVDSNTALLCWLANPRIFVWSSPPGET
jgi:hypothetical protein